MFFWRNSAHWRSEKPVTSVPAIVILPRVGFSSPAMMLRRVDFPEPEVPRMQQISPSSISSEMLLSATMRSRSTR